MRTVGLSWTLYNAGCFSSVAHSVRALNTGLGADRHDNTHLHIKQTKCGIGVGGNGRGEEAFSARLGSCRSLAWAAKSLACIRVRLDVTVGCAKAQPIHSQTRFAAPNRAL